MRQKKIAKAKVGTVIAEDIYEAAKLFKGITDKNQTVIIKYMKWMIYLVII